MPLSRKRISVGLQVKNMFYLSVVQDSKDISRLVVSKARRWISIERRGDRTMDYKIIHVSRWLLRFWLVVACTGVLLNLGASPAWAQSISAGTVSGQVTDQQNAVVPGAEMTLLTSRQTLTNDRHQRDGAIHICQCSARHLRHLGRPDGFLDGQGVRTESNGRPGTHHQRHAGGRRDFGDRRSHGGGGCPAADVERDGRDDDRGRFSHIAAEPGPRRLRAGHAASGRDADRRGGRSRERPEHLPARRRQQHR